MGEIDNHSQAVHFFNHVSPGRGYAAPERRSYSRDLVNLYQGGICIEIVAVMGQRRVADAERIIVA
jgi:hypothetical protein